MTALTEHQHAETLTSLTAQVERCARRIERAAERLASAETEVADAAAAEARAIDALSNWKRANPDPQMEMTI